MHRRFEELCALAITGQLQPEAAELLAGHLSTCGECREFLADAGELQAYLSPALFAEEIEITEPPAGIRERFLERAAAEDMALSPGDPLQQKDAEQLTPLQESAHPWRLRWHGVWDHTPLRAAGLAATACCCIVLGYSAAKLGRPAMAIPPSSNTAPAAMANLSNDPQSQPASSLYPASPSPIHSDFEQTQAKLSEVQRQLSHAEAQNAELKQSVENLRQSEAANHDLQRALTEVQHREQETSEQIAAFETTRDNLTSTLAATRLKIGAQDERLAEANNRITGMEEELAHAQASAQNVGIAKEMISSRNLHIIDIYDGDTSGHSRQLSGRVFYVEGKSLVFFAYDLPDTPRKQTQQVFHVWGETAGASTASFELGIMHRETQVVGRWVLSFNDPKVLNRINAVYISTDPPSLAPENPHRMMYAFLGSANHP